MELLFVHTRKGDLVVSKAKNTENQEWFKRFALTVREIVVAHGGAIAMTKAELQDAVREEDSSFKNCPMAVLEHPTLPLNKWAQLSVSSFDGRRSDILLIHFASMPTPVARTRCKSNGLSEAVNIALLEGART